MTVQPGPGERADPPGYPPPRTGPAGSRLFKEPVETWIKSGTRNWWRVVLEGMPPPGDEDRRRRYNATRNAWMRELARQRGEGKLSGEYSSHLTEVDGVTYFTWGPAVPPPSAHPGGEYGEDPVD